MALYNGELDIENYHCKRVYMLRAIPDNDYTQQKKVTHTLAAKDIDKRRV